MQKVVNYSYISKRHTSLSAAAKEKTKPDRFQENAPPRHRPNNPRSPDNSSDPAMASPSDPSQLAHRKQQKGPPFKFLVPLIYAPVLPLIRLGLRKNPVLRDRLFTLVLAGGFAHGLYLVYPF
ncbi:hypothetical protein SLEP1_g18338 [Rubroshorea leprosula]|uniref:Uncharacterized protein n=1 Tax=Rubroshorea leprosula TaxID=152421 RepID=A0AAV5J6C1_9ROSI|nr:hypothetical protein SLEP1_g18338 [Rubroshorea leprosula]